jgi:hypothetical protein
MTLRSAAIPAFSTVLFLLRSKMVRLPNLSPAYMWFWGLWFGWAKHVTPLRSIELLGGISRTLPKELCLRRLGTLVVVAELRLFDFFDFFVNFSEDLLVYDFVDESKNKTCSKKGEMKIGKEGRLPERLGELVFKKIRIADVPIV